MSRKVSINAAAADAIRAHGIEAFPEECCGFMYGKDGEVRLISEVQRTENIAAENRKRRFKIAPLAYIKAERYALEQGLDFLGIYHTHPNHPAIASEHDRKQAVPHFSYVILSVQEGEPAELLSWELREDGQMEEQDFSETKDTILSQS